MEKYDSFRYFKERRAKRKARGLCIQCAAPMPIGRKVARCLRCRDQNNALIQKRSVERKAAKLCVVCGGPNTDPVASCVACRTKKQEFLRARKTRILVHYGESCVCCGEDIQMLLNIDHINNDGKEHRKQIKATSGAGFYGWLIKNKFPPGFQTLCWSCNMGKHLNGGVCPHQTVKTEIDKICDCKSHKPL